MTWYYLWHLNGCMRRSYFSYLHGARLTKARCERRFVVRVFHPRGRYLKGKIAMREGLYWADDDIVFCVTFTQRWDGDNEVSYTEMDWLSLDELRFIGSILLCEMSERPRLLFYPICGYSPVINRKNIDLTKSSTAKAIHDLVIQGIDFPKWPRDAIILEECTTLRYSFMPDKELDLSRQMLFWEGIEKDNYLLLRGLSALIKSDMLSSYPEFTEESIVSCFVALEVSYRMIIKKLKGEGVPDPGAKDAAIWLHKHFDGPLGHNEPLERYFSEFYDRRVMTIHPSSRFGEFPYAPLMVDDYYDLRESLRAIIGYLVLGDHDRGFLKAIERHQQGHF